MNTQREYLEQGLQFYRERRYGEAVACFHRTVAFLCGTRDVSLSATAASYLGRLHYEGLGVPKDPYTALQWNRLIASWFPACCDRTTRENIARLEESGPRPQPWPKAVEEPGLGRVILKKTRSYDRVGRLREHENALEVYVEAEHPYDYGVCLAWGHVLDRLCYSALPEILDEHTEDVHPLFQWRIEQGTGNGYGYRREGNRYTTVSPCDVRFDELITRQSLIRQRSDLMYRAAEEFLPRRLEELSRKTGIPYTWCRIIRRRGAILGYCHYQQGGIVLAHDLMVLSPLQVDAIIIHELCHMLHHSHSKKFYEAFRHYGGDDIAQADLNGYILPPRDDL